MTDQDQKTEKHNAPRDTDAETQVGDNEQRNTGTATQGNPQQNANVQNNDSENGPRNTGTATQQEGNPQQNANVQNNDGGNGPRNTGTATQQEGAVPNVQPNPVPVKPSGEENDQQTTDPTSGKNQVDKKADERSEEKSYYDNRGRGLLCILQFNNDWDEGHKQDREVLKKFFEDTLGFDIKVYPTYDELDRNLQKDFDFKLKRYYCLVIFISCHGNEDGILVENNFLKTVCEITTRFGNRRISWLAGVPKIFILDACRGSKKDEGVKAGKKVQDTPFHTSESDCLVVHATTHGYVARIPATGSVATQGVMQVLTKNWQKDHLEEMLIDARAKVASVLVNNFRQTVEIQTTLLKRLKFR